MNTYYTILNGGDNSFSEDLGFDLRLTCELKGMTWFLSLCVCVCVCVREREREQEREMYCEVCFNEPV